MAFDWGKKEEIKNGEAVTTNTEAAKPNEPSIAEQIAAALKPFSDGFGALNTRLDTIESATRKPEPVVNHDTPSVFEDENTAFNTRLTPIMLRQLELEARVVKNDIKAEYVGMGFGDLWGQYASQIDSQLDNSALVDASGKVLRGNPEYIRNVVDMVLGRAARQSGIRFDGKNKAFFLESAGGSNETTGAPVNDGMTDKQRRVFQRMGISLDKAKDTMGKLEFVQ